MKSLLGWEFHGINPYDGIALPYGTVRDQTPTALFAGTSSVLGLDGEIQFVEPSPDLVIGIAPANPKTEVGARNMGIFWTLVAPDKAARDKPFAVWTEDIGTIHGRIFGQYDVRAGTRAEFGPIDLRRPHGTPLIWTKDRQVLLRNVEAVLFTAHFLPEGCIGLVIKEKRYDAQWAKVWTISG